MADVPPTAHPFELVNVLRPDEVRPVARPRRGPRRRARGRGRSLQGAADPRRGAVTASTASRSRRRSGAAARSAAEVVEEHLARIDEREAELHAFNLVLADEARAAAAEIDRRVAAGEDPGPLAGVPVALKDNMAPGASRRRARRGSSRAGARRTTPPSSRGCATRARSLVGQDEPRRVRHGLVDGELGVRSDPQPARPDPGAGRVLGRQRGGRRRRVRAARPRLRHRRLDPPAGRAVRRRRA